MADWGGFSEAELRHLRSGGDSNQPQKPTPKKTSSKKGLVAKKTTKPKPPKTSPDALLPTSQPEPTEVKKPEIETVKSNPIPETVEKELITDENEILEKKKIEVEDLNRIQREMEEKNKRRKAALSQEIFDRQKRAAAETKMLKTIEAELAKLDQLLNADVAVLRDQIDTASCEFNEAKRRFDQAEKEYVDSKFDLQQKTEAKDTLTEHLVHLIQLNEERKLKKLEELTFKLSMDPEVVAKREKEAAEQLKLEEEEKKKKMESDRLKRLEEEARLKAEAAKSQEEPNPEEVKPEENESKPDDDNKVDSSQLKGTNADPPTKPDPVTTDQPE